MALKNRKENCIHNCTVLTNGWFECCNPKRKSNYCYRVCKNSEFSKKTKHKSFLMQIALKNEKETI